METNKLLTLEEIENLEKSAHARALVGNVWFEALLATARAYHEIAKESIEDERRYVETLWQDKPHPATLKVIVEALNLGVGTIWVDHCAKEVFMPEKVIKNLSSILKKYAKKQ